MVLEAHAALVDARFLLRLARRQVEVPHVVLVLVAGLVHCLEHGLGPEQLAGGRFFFFGNRL